MAFNPEQVLLDGFTQENFVFTMLGSGEFTRNDIGKAVTLDTTSPATVKLAGDGDAVYGRVFQVEDRTQEGLTTISVETRFRKRLQKEESTTMNVGDTAIGAGDGFVKSAATADPAANKVLFATGNYAIVEQ